MKSIKIFLLPLNISIGVCIVVGASVGLLQGQTLNDPDSSAGDAASMLELPPALVVKGAKESVQAKALSKIEKALVKPDAKAIKMEAPILTQGNENTGIQIQVEKTNQKNRSRNQAGPVKVYSPWPAKPISSPPEGWMLTPAPKSVEPFRTQVKLGSGNTVDLSITPYMLVPIADGKTSIKIPEPGYQAGHQQGQQNTLGLMLSNSITEIENHEKQAAKTIERLQQLLSSLPREQNNE